MAEHPAEGNSGNLLGGSTWLLREGSAGEHGAEDTRTSGQQAGAAGELFSSETKRTLALCLAGRKAKKNVQSSQFERRTEQ